MDEETPMFTPRPWVAKAEFATGVVVHKGEMVWLAFLQANPHQPDSDEAAVIARVVMHRNLVSDLMEALSEISSDPEGPTM